MTTHARPRVLVCTTVHPADDPRVRRRHVAVLARAFTVRYATPAPAPADTSDHEWVVLAGGRLRRGLAAARQLLRRDVDLVSVQDPELVPAAVLARVLRRIPVVVDVHEDVPAQLRTKPWLPRPLRAPLAAVAALLLRLAERTCSVTLAESGYARRFRRDHPVLPNYPLDGDLPDPRASDGSIVYLGDIREARGALLAVRAVAAAAPGGRLRMVGRCLPPLAARLRALAGELGVDLDLPGFLPHRDALAVAAGAAVGLCPLTDEPNYRHSLPTKVIEYLAVGVPTLASDLPGTARIARGLPGVQLLPPDDLPAWTQALRDALADDELRATTAAAAPDVRARFTWPADELLSIYRSLLEGR